MASYTVVKAKTATLGAGVADSVTVTGKYRRIRIVNHHATGRISFTMGAGGAPTAATADGDDTMVVPANATVVPYDDATANSVAVTVEDTDIVFSLISATACPYSVVAE